MRSRWRKGLGVEAYTRHQVPGCSQDFTQLIQPSHPSYAHPTRDVGMEVKYPSSQGQSQDSNQAG